jgi:hypothetical protein
MTPPTRPNRLAALGGRLLGVALGALAWLALAEPALADHCFDPADCFNVQRAALAAAVGVGALTGLSIVLDFIPVVGTAKGIVEAITGRDAVTGERLATWERAIGWIPFFKVGRAADAVGALAGLGRTGDALAGAGALGRGAEAPVVPGGLGRGAGLGRPTPTRPPQASGSRVEQPVGAGGRALQSPQATTGGQGPGGTPATPGGGTPGTPPGGGHGPSGGGTPGGGPPGGAGHGGPPSGGPSGGAGTGGSSGHGDYDPRTRSDRELYRDLNDPSRVAAASREQERRLDLRDASLPREAPRVDLRENDRAYGSLPQSAAHTTGPSGRHDPDMRFYRSQASKIDDGTHRQLPDGSVYHTGPRYERTLEGRLTGDRPWWQEDHWRHYEDRLAHGQKPEEAESAVREAARQNFSYRWKDDAAMNREVNAYLRKHWERIRDDLAQDGMHEGDDIADDVIGEGFYNRKYMVEGGLDHVDAGWAETRTYRVVLKTDPNDPGKIYVHTAFPTGFPQG